MLIIFVSFLCTIQYYNIRTQVADEDIVIAKELDSDWSTVHVRKSPEKYSSRLHRPSLLNNLKVEDCRQLSTALKNPSLTDENHRFWKDIVLPQWSLMCRSALVVKVWHRDGIPAILRRMVWCFAILVLPHN